MLNYHNKTIVLADRGQGILKTIRNVRPETKNEKEALKIAFTEVISGRSPELRGNGLKFVTKVLKEKKWNLRFDSGRGNLTISPSRNMKTEDSNNNVYGCFAVIKYS